MATADRARTLAAAHHDKTAGRRPDGGRHPGAGRRDGARKGSRAANWSSPNLAMQYLQKLDSIEKRFEELTQQMADPAVISDSEQYRKVTKAQSELADVVAKYPRVEEGRARISSRPARCSRRPIPTCGPWPKTEMRASRAGDDADRGRAQDSAAAQGSERREERRARNPRRHGRRRGHAVCRRSLPHVHALRGNAAAGKWK